MKLPLLFAVLISSMALATPPPGDHDFETVDGLIHALYNMVTFEAGTTPDWEEARSAFIPEALVVMRMGEHETAVLNVQGWIDDFVSFIETRDVMATGFSETIIKMKTTQMGDIAHVLVLYESHLPGHPRRQGVDSFQLIRKDGRWWILSIANELPRWGRKVPDELLE